MFFNGVSHVVFLLNTGPVSVFNNTINLILNYRFIHFKTAALFAFVSAAYVLGGLHSPGDPHVKTNTWGW